MGEMITKNDPFIGYPNCALKRARGHICEG